MSSQTPIIRRAQTDDEIQATFAVMSQLRPHLGPDEYLSTVRRMERSDGFRLVCAEADGAVVGVAGYRVMEMLYAGRILSVDDLVTDEAARSGGHGNRLLDWLRTEACDLGCVQVHLDSRVIRERAHRFYFREGFHILGFHFVVDVPRES